MVPPTLAHTVVAKGYSYIVFVTTVKKLLSTVGIQPILKHEDVSVSMVFRYCTKGGYDEHHTRRFLVS